MLFLVAAGSARGKFREIVSVAVHTYDKPLPEWCSDFSTVTFNTAAGAGASLAMQIAEQVASAMHLVARASNLLRLASLVAANGTLAQNGIQLDVSMLNKASSQARPFRPEDVPRLHLNDEVHVDIKNTGDQAVDVNVLYVDSRFGIQCLRPYRAEVSSLMPGERDSVPIAFDGQTLGTERILIVAIRRRRDGVGNSLAFLAQSPLEAARSAKATRAGADTDDLQAFRDAAFATFDTRAFSLGANIDAL